MAPNLKKLFSMWLYHGQCTIKLYLTYTCVIVNDTYSEKRCKNLFYFIQIWKKLLPVVFTDS